MNLIRYDTGKFPFRDIVCTHFGVRELESIREDREVLSRDKDQSTAWHRKFYAIGDDYFDCYHAFLKDIIRPLYNRPFVYQKIPTFRVHLQNNVAVGAFHRDRDYNHGCNEVNYWLPFTDAWGTNTIWIESEEGKQDFRPHPVKYGEVLEFDGANLEHGNQVNTTGRTRVSVDFRIVPLASFVPSGFRSINTATPFTIGGYFEVLS